ncbi:MAG: TRAP transporter substrate-binding protein DctP [Candidatus Aureabacteria bacterium]|nr:TRAP transporter substrate-binding protein DctP [Candidatus Auribacterota bacterium]
MHQVKQSFISLYFSKTGTTRWTNKKRFAGLVSLCFYVFSFFVWSASCPAATIIKFASLAPEGTTWMKVMNEWDQDIRQKTSGNLSFRFYPGGVAGDEKDVIRKIRIGQLHAGGFTGVGFGEIAPEVRLLDAPFLFNSIDEVDHIYDVFDKEWKEAFEKNNYVLLGWAEVGFVYLFTKKSINNLTDMKGMKMWLWEGDPIAEAAYKAMDISPVPLSIADVTTSLQTGLIEGVYSSPMAAIALQWSTRTKFMFNVHLANSAGCVLIYKPYFDKMPKEYQTLLLETGRKYLGNLTQLSRKENVSAIESMKQNGVTVTTPTANSEDYQSIGIKARQMLVDKLYSSALLNRVEKSLEEYRFRKK